MKRLNVRKSAVTVWAAVPLVFLLAFQNCSDVSFESMEDSLSKVNGPSGPGGGSSNDGDLDTILPPIVAELPDLDLDLHDPMLPLDPTDPMDPGTPLDPSEPIVELPPDMPTLPPEPPVAQCDPGFTMVNGSCVQTEFSECLSFKELDTSFIPSLQSTGVCYYKKLLNASDNRTSGSWGEQHAMDVTARGHAGNGIHPYILGDTKMDLTFFSQRNISLTSSSVGNTSEISAQKLKIDNFILVEVSDDQKPKRMLARGTKDAEPENGGRIKVNGVAVTDFISYADGGTATVDVIDVTQSFTIGVKTELRVRMLDNGGSAETSAMYLIIH